MNEAKHKRPYVIWFYLCEISRIDTSTEVEYRLVVARNWWEEGLWIWRNSLVDKGFYFGVMTMFWSKTEVMAPPIMNVAPLYTWKWLVYVLLISSQQFWKKEGVEEEDRQANQPGDEERWDCILMTWLRIPSKPSLEWRAHDLVS